MLLLIFLSNMHVTVSELKTPFYRNFGVIFLQLCESDMSVADEVFEKESGQQEQAWTMWR